MNARLLAAAAAALTAVACGGSSKSNPTPPPPSATYAGPTGAASLGASTDKTALVGTAASMAQALSGMSSMALLFGAGANQQPMGAKQVMTLAADLYHRGDAGLSGAVTNTTQPCPDGGSFTVTVNHQDAAPEVTTSGDYVAVSFAGCNQGGAVSEGSFRLTIDRTAGDDFVMTPSSITSDRGFGLTIAYQSLLLVNPNDGWWVGFDGDLGVAFAATVATGTIEYGIAGTHFDQAAGVGAQVAAGVRLAPLAGQARYHDTAVETYTGLGTASAALASTTWDLDARLCTTELGGCVNVETDPVFVFHGDPETSYPAPGGAVTVSDDAGDWVRATATDETTGACTVSWHVDAADGSLSTFWDSL